MRSIINHTDLLLDQIRNVKDSEHQWQHVLENNMSRFKRPELKITYAYSPKQPVEKAHKFVKTKLYIKNMVSTRCKIVVKAVLENIGLHYTKVELGEAEITENLSEEKHDRLKAALHKFGLELMEDQRKVLIEKVKNIIVEMIHYEDELPKIKISDYLSEKLHHSYFMLSRLWSEVRGTTIQHYILAQKIERAKELIAYDELTLSEIAYKLHYSSVSHLSNQFKKYTGLTPSHFKEMKQKRRISLENVRMM